MTPNYPGCDFCGECEHCPSHELRPQLERCPDFATQRCNSLEPCFRCDYEDHQWRACPVCQTYE